MSLQPVGPPGVSHRGQPLSDDELRPILDEHPPLAALLERVSLVFPTVLYAAHARKVSSITSMLTQSSSQLVFSRIKRH
jgi:hypothetical protein